MGSGGELGGLSPPSCGLGARTHQVRLPLDAASASKESGLGTLLCVRLCVMCDVSTLQLSGFSITSLGAEVP